MLSSISKTCTSRRITHRLISYQGHQAPGRCIGRSRLTRNQSTSPTVVRYLSSEASTASTTNSAPVGPNPTKAKSAGDHFLDNIGKIFFMGIGLIIGALVRSSKGNSNRVHLREELENIQVTILDPIEIDELRIANDELTADVFRRVADRAFSSTGTLNISYSKFLSIVKDEMSRVGKGDEFTVQFGHLLDRVIFSAKDYFDKDDENSEWRVNIKSFMDENNEIPIAFLLTVYSLALNSSVDQRIELLYEVMKHDTVIRTGNDYQNGQIDAESTKRLISYLQISCQLPTETQVIEKPNSKYPIQQYIRASAEDLFDRANEDIIDKQTSESNKVFSLEDFSNILCAPSVCAWGECYSKKRRKNKT